MTTGQGYVGDWEVAVSTRLVTKPDAWMLTYAGQAHAVFVTQHTPVVVKVRVALGSCEKSSGGKPRTPPYQGSAGMSAGKLEFAWK